jgi:hypothetical protein
VVSSGTCHDVAYTLVEEIEKATGWEASTTGDQITFP